MSFKQISLGEFFDMPEEFEMVAHPETIWGQTISYYLVEGQPRVILFENLKTAWMSDEFSGSINKAVVEIVCANGV